jgi:hypothetical protein
MGTLFVAYAAIRFAIYWEFRSRPPAEPRWDPTESMGQPIDTSKLSSRVEQLRQGSHSEAAEKSPSFKKPLLVEERRRVMEKMSFFQKPPPPEPTEHEDGVHWMFI